MLKARQKHMCTHTHIYISIIEIRMRFHVCERLKIERNKKKKKMMMMNKEWDKKDSHNSS